MAFVVDTEVVAPHERFDLWTEVSARVFEPVDVLRRDKRPFAARLLRYELGPLSVYHMCSDPSTVRRTLATIRASNPEWVHVMLQLRGRCGVSQDHRSAIVTPGQFIGWQSSSPYAIESPVPFEALIVALPSLLLGPHIDRLCRRTAQAIDGDAGLGRLVNHYFRELLDGLADGTLVENDQQIAESVVDLVRTLYLQGGDPEPVVRSADVLRGQIKRFIDARLADPELGPETIAREHFISRSYLDKLFAAEGSSVWESIKAKRLDRCRHDLLDPSLDGESIFEIAVRWGFVSAPHFSRVFRGAYGLSPRDFRGMYRRPAQPA